MRFLYLSQIGNSYAGLNDAGVQTGPGEEGTPGHRNEMRCWAKIQEKLKLAILNLQALEKPPATAGNNASISARKAFFQKAAAFNGAQNQSAIIAARKEVDQIRLWLKRSGAKAQADGTILATDITPKIVMYDHTLAEQGATRIYISGGRLYTDSAGTKPLDTGKMATHFSGVGKAIFVMSQSGNIHVDSHVLGNRHHSSLLAGTPVACAGEMEVQQGKLLWLSNKSGHYLPNLDHLMQILHMLQKKNVPLTFRLSVFMNRVTKDYATVGEFMRELQLTDEQPDYELGKLLQYSAYLDNVTLGQRNWRWRFPDEAPGVYDMATNARVRHKDVRQWLKQTKGNQAGQVNLQLGTGR